MNTPLVHGGAAVTADGIEELARELIARSGGRNWRAERDYRAPVLAESVQRLVAPDAGNAEQLRATLQRETGLSAPMVEWGLTHLGESFEVGEVLRLASSLEAPPGMWVTVPSLTVLVLSGNVFTAAIRAMALPLLAGSSTLVKLKIGSGSLVRAWHRHLADVDEKLAGQVAVVEFDRSSESCSAALFKYADVVSAYGNDETMGALRRQVPSNARLVEHGHGLSLAYVPGSAISNQTQLDSVAAGLALDVAAYDQLGCLSPQAVLVEAGAWGGQEELVVALHAALAELTARLPRGDVSDEQAARIVQWQGVAMARGALHRGQTYGCSAEGGPLRSSPGFRQIGVYTCAGVTDLVQQCAPLGSHIKALGVAGSTACRMGVGGALPPGLSPRICALGEMQRPTLNACFDGQSPFFGLVNYIQVD